MIFRFLWIRLLQLQRSFATLSWWHWVFMGVFGSLFGAILYRQMNVYPNGLYATGFLVLILISVHTYRTDSAFISLTGINYRKIFTAEYIFFSLPVLIIIFFSTGWYGGFILLAACFGIPFIPFYNSQRIRKPHSVWFIPPDNFEWNAGMRKNGWYFLVLYPVGLALLFYPYASLFILWLMLSMVASFYIECESWPVLQGKELAPARFLKEKLTTHLKLYCLLSLPLVVGYMIFHFSTAWVALLVYVISMINVAFFILSKYAVYSPNEKLSSNNIIVSLVHLCMVIPFLLPLPLLMSIRAYRKSLANLENYLDAYH